MRMYVYVCVCTITNICIYIKVHSAFFYRIARSCLSKLKKISPTHSLPRVWWNPPKKSNSFPWALNPPKTPSAMPKGVSGPRVFKNHALPSLSCQTRKRLGPKHLSNGLGFLCPEAIQKLPRDKTDLFTSFFHVPLGCSIFEHGQGSARDDWGNVCRSLQNH